MDLIERDENDTRLQRATGWTRQCIFTSPSLLSCATLPSFYKLRMIVVVRERERYDLLLSPLKETRVHIALPCAERRENGDKRCERKERQRRQRRGCGSTRRVS